MKRIPSLRAAISWSLLLIPFAAACGDASELETSPVRVASQSVDLQEVDVCWSSADGTAIVLATGEDFLNPDNPVVTNPVHVPLGTDIGVSLIPTGHACDSDQAIELELRRKT